tara:strand:+ start:590 stop:1285 length:696 start_codon:yes stop_codon:yes gene_type:complete
MNTKTCTKCGIDKPLNDYHNRKDSKDGKKGQCKECSRNASRAWIKENKERHRKNALTWTKANPERKRINDHKYRQKNREQLRDTSNAWHQANKERSLASNRAWHEANRERTRVNNRAWREANRERSRANARAWYKENKERSLANVRARRARKAHAVPQRWKRSPCPDHLCYWCGTTLTPETTHIDHIMPISLGGQDTPNNTANTCAKCNLTKHNTHPLVWLARITTPEPVC